MESKSRRPDDGTLAFMEDFIRAQETAMTALVTAIAQCVDKDKLEESLRLQLVTTKFDPAFTARPRAQKMLESLLEAAWKAVRRPVPRE